MLRNRHDTWQRFCRVLAAPLKGTGLPAVVTRAEHRLRDLLASGTVSAGTVTFALGELTEEQWQCMEEFAEVFFQEFESVVPLDLFSAFRREVERRETGFQSSGHRRRAKKD